MIPNPQPYGIDPLVDEAESKSPTSLLQGTYQKLAEGLIDLRSMNPLLRVVTIISFALLTGTAVLLPINGLFAPTIAIGVLGSSTLQLTLPASIGIIVLLVIGLVYAVAGAVQLAWWLRLLTIGTLSWVLIQLPLAQFRLTESRLSRRASAVTRWARVPIRGIPDSFSSLLHCWRNR